MYSGRGAAEMKSPSSDELNELMHGEQEICVSIYVPRQRSGGWMQEDRILFKNLLRNAERHLLTKGLRPLETETLLYPAHNLLEDGLFWEQDANGFVLFIAPRGMCHYQLSLKPDALVVVAHHFHILPLLSQQETNHSFYILALSRNQVRLLHGLQSELTEMNLKGLPKNLEQALGYETPEKQNGARPLPASVGGGGRRAIFYGQSAGPEDGKDELVRYLRVIDAALRGHFKDRGAPLVLAAVDYFFPLYREVNSYPYLVEEGIEGNPEKASLAQLYMRGWEIVQPLFKQAEREALARYQQLVGTGLASCDLEEVLRAAFQGRVRVLFVAPHVQKWGSFDSTTESISVQPTENHDGEELLNLAALYALSKNGEIYFIEPGRMPAGEYIAATFRY